MAKGIPRSSRGIRSFFIQAAPYDFALAALACIPGVVGAWKFFDENRPGPAWICLIVAVLGFVVAFIKTSVLWWFKPEDQPPHDLAGSLYALHGILMADVGADKEPGLRLTIHVPKDNDANLEQVIDYVGNSRCEKTSERTFSVHCGIIGQAFRKKTALVAARKNDNYDKYIAELVSEWGYKEADARKLDASSMAWMAVPLHSQHDHGKVVGIVYLDAKDKDFFTEIRQNQVLLACTGIAKWVGMRYN
jgi:hypothetical protein